MTGGNYYPDDYHDYDVERLREAAGLNPVDEEPNYKCQNCSWYQHIDDHERHTPNWCECCQQMRTFVRLDD